MDENTKIPVELLPANMKTILGNREWKGTEITPREIAKEYAGWNLGDPEWADAIITIYNDALDIVINLETAK